MQAIAASTVRAWPTALTDTPRSRLTATTIGVRTTMLDCVAVVARTSGSSRRPRVLMRRLLDDGDGVAGGEGGALAHVHPCDLADLVRGHLVIPLHGLDDAGQSSPFPPGPLLECLLEDAGLQR